MFEIKNLYKSFGGISAIFDLNLTINQGEIVGLIGPNGAGKTTLFNLITGFLKPDKGSIMFNGKSITGLRPHKIAEKGIVRTFQDGAVFPTFTVMQNITSAHYLKPKLNFWDALLNKKSYQEREYLILKEANKVIELLGLKDVKEHFAKSLPHGYKKLVSLGIAIACNPLMLLLDEPLSGMSAQEVDFVVSVIKNVWKQRRITVFIIEHNVRATMKLCERIIVLDMGKKIAEGTPEDIKRNERVIAAYFGN